MYQVIEIVKVGKTTLKMRAPTDEETEQIKLVAGKKYARAVRIGKRLTFGLLIFVAFMLFAAGRENFLKMLCVMSIFLAAAAFAWHGVKWDTRILNKVMAGDFVVLNGKVCKLDSYSDRPGFRLVKFETEYGTVFPQEAAVLARGVEIGTPLLIVCCKGCTKKGIVPGVFTRDMLKDASWLRP